MTPRLLDLVIDALATYRLARFVVYEDAPPAVAVRGVVEGRAPEDWRGVVDCAHCAGLWVALAVGVARHVPGWRAVAWPLAVAGAASFAHTVADAVTEVGMSEPQGPVTYGNGGPRDARLHDPRRD